MLHFPQDSPHLYPIQCGYSDGQLNLVSCTTPVCPQHNGSPTAVPLSATHLIEVGQEVFVSVFALTSVDELS